MEENRVNPASQDSYDRGESRESYAYPFIHNFNIKEIFGDMKFDVIIGNPPYQLSDGGGAGGASASPLYNKFVQKAKEMNPKYISMIIPSRWMKGGKGLDDFRKEMIEDTRLQYIIDYENSKELFPQQGVNGGICYFLWNSTHTKEVLFTHINTKGEVLSSKRYLKNNFIDTVIRDYRQIDIIQKVVSTTNEFFDKIVSTQSPFGFRSDLFNRTERYEGVNLKETIEPGYCAVYGIIGSNGGAKRIQKYINKESVKINQQSLPLYKLFFSKAYSETSTIPPKIIKGTPWSLCTETFLKIGDFNSETEMNNCLSYIETKFFRAIFHYNRYSFNISKKSFSAIPLQDFSKPWTDEELYKKYGLTEEEIAYIEENIAPMD